MTATAPHLRVAIVGAGNMGGCLAAGLLEAGLPGAQLTVIDPRPEALAPWAGRGVTTVAEAHAASGRDLVVIAVKPQVAGAALPPLASVLSPGQVVVSLMAGVTTQSVESHLPARQPVVRAMPQTLVRLGAGATALCPGRHAGVADLVRARTLFDRVGITVEVTEAQMDAVTGLSGSGPAYIYTVVEALADGGVRAGLPRPVALRLAAQTVAGAGRMVQETGEHPAALRDQVTSPAGTTIAGLAALEAGGLRHALIAAVTAACQRSRELGRG